MSLGRAFVGVGIVLAGCAPRPAPESATASLPIRVVAVMGLRVSDPVLDRLGSDLQSTPVLATGMGAAAALEFLDGRDAVDQLRSPRDPLAWAHARGWTTRIELRDPAVRSAPEWVHGLALSERRATPPERDQVDLHVIIVSREALDEAEFRDLLKTAPVILAGIPHAPPRNRGRVVGADPDEVLDQLTVPVLARGLDPELGSTPTLGDALARVRERSQPKRETRIARWWNARGGGVLVDDGSRIAVGGSGREPVLVRGDDPSRAAELVDAATPAGSLLVLIRGSAGADLTSLEILTGGQANWAGWGLEPIDTVQHPSPRYLQLDLAVEPEGDGILIENAGAQVIELRLLAALEDAPVLGAPVRDAAGGRWMGLDGIRISPWSRDFWRLTRGVEFDVDRWWRRSGAGVDLLWVPDGVAPPAPVALGD